MRASPGAAVAVKLCLGDLLVMGSNPETAFLHMQGQGCVQYPSPIPSHSEEPLGNGVRSFI